MAKMSQGLKLKQQQSMIMTPQMQQAIKLLTLTHMEMTDLIASEMVENPMLEESGKEHSSEELKGKTKEEMQNQEATADNFSGPEMIEGGKDQFDWDKYVDTFNTNSSSPPSMVGKSSPEEAPNYENMVSKGMSLAEHLEWQLRMEELSADEWKVAYQIVHNINDDGFLDTDFEEIIASSELDREYCLDILNMVQNLDPVGCGSRDLQECLLVQAKAREMRTPLVELLIREHLQQLKNNDHKALSKQLGVELESIKNAEMIILTLHPKPGRLVSPGEIHYVIPDIYIHQVGDQLVASLNDEGVPSLRVSNLYRRMLKSKNASSDEQEYVQDKLRSAMWLIKSIENRQKTILKVAEAILKYQPEFFKKGTASLKPMILKDIAAEIGMHESTVSRVTTNKYMHTPIGTFELKFFFNAGIGGKNGGIDTTSESLKLKIKELIENESPKKPLSDQKIADLLKTQDVVVARRTVAKYREMMNILPSSKRKEK